MTAHEAKILQREFNLSFPEDYLTIITGVVARDINSEALVVSVEDLRESNLAFRAEDQWGFRWESRFWWIGGDGAGGFYFINTEEITSEVYYCDHEDSPADFADRKRLYSSDIGNHVSDQVEMEAETQSYNEKMRAKVASRRWWQVWIPRTWSE